MKKSPTKKNNILFPKYYLFPQHRLHISSEHATESDFYILPFLYLQCKRKILLMKHKTFVIKEIFIFFSICIAFCVQSMRKKYILNQQICASLKNILPQIWNSTGEILCSSRFKIYLFRKKDICIL